MLFMIIFLERENNTINKSMVERRMLGVTNHYFILFFLAIRREERNVIGAPFVSYSVIKSSSFKLMIRVNM